LHRLFTYTITHDTGLAPNPFFGICTLALCKPKIRSVATVNDWIAATGTEESGFGRKLIYAMQVTSIMTFEEYDNFCNAHLRNKIPNMRTLSIIDKVGDCQIGYSASQIIYRDGIHNEVQLRRDLDGRNVLLSDKFIYFGADAKELPDDLLPIIHKRGHKSNANSRYFERFLEWFEILRRQHGLGQIGYPSGSFCNSSKSFVCDDDDSYSEFVSVC